MEDGVAGVEDRPVALRGIAGGGRLSDDRRDLIVTGDMGPSRDRWGECVGRELPGCASSSSSALWTKLGSVDDPRLGMIGGR